VFSSVKRATTKLKRNFKAQSADMIAGAHAIPDYIEKCIRTADLIVCDLSEARPNVYYELGFARALGKPIICIAKSGEKLHFDISHLKTIFYETYEELENTLRRDMASLVQGDAHAH